MADAETTVVEQPAGQLTNPYRPVQFTDESGQPAQLTPQEQAQLRKAGGLVDPVLDLSADEMADLARETLKEDDPANRFNPLSAFQARRAELETQPEAVNRVAAAWDKYTRGTDLEDLPNPLEMAKNATHFATSAVKYGGKLLWNYGKRLGEMVTGQENPETARNLAEVAAASETALAGLGDLVATSPERIWRALVKTGTAGMLIAPKARKEVVSALIPQRSPQDQVTKLFSDLEKAEIMKETLSGKGPLANTETAKKLEEAGFPVRPEEVESLAAGDLLSLYLFGKAFGGVSKVAPTVVPARTLAAAGEKVAQVGGKAIELTGKVGQAVLPKAAKAAPAIGAIQGATIGHQGGSLWAGAALGYGAGKIAAKRLMKAVPVAKELEAAGQQIAGKELVAGSYTQLVKDLFQSAPAAGYEVGKGLAFDVGFGASAETPEEAAGVGVGTLFGMLGGGARTAGHVISGLLIDPRAYGLKTPVKSQGILPELEPLHQQSYNAAPPGIKQRVNALRDFFKGVFPDREFIFASRPAEGQPDPLVAKLKDLGVPENTANEWAGQEGISTRDFNGKKLILARDVDAAPHEGGHVLEDVLGESIMRQLDQVVQKDPQYKNNWDALAQSYAASVRDKAGKPMWNPVKENWQEFLLRVTKWGDVNAAEKLVSQEGMGPHPEGRAQALWNEAVAKAPGATPQEKQTNAWKSILTPQEQAEVANRYISREVLAENFDAMLKHTGAFSIEDNSIPARLARVMGAMIHYMGGEPLAGRGSEFRRFPLSYELTRFQERAVGKLRGGKPAEQPPTPKKAKVFGPPVTPEDQQKAAEDAKVFSGEASDTPPEPGAQSPRTVLGILAEAIGGRNSVLVEGRAAAPGDPSSAITSNRNTRRKIIEIWRYMPDAAKNLVQKLFFPTRVIKTKGGTYQIEGWSPEVLAANAQKLAEFLNKTEMLPQNVPLPEGVVLDATTASFTPESWKLIFDNLDKFAANQRAGRTGAGEPLVVPKEVTETGGYAPPVSGKPEPIPQDMADFLNYLYNFKIPETPIIRGEKVPINVQAQRVSEATLPGRVTEPARVRGEFGRYGKTAKTQERQAELAEQMGIEGMRVQETNPFRQTIETAAQNAGVDAPSLFEVIQHLNVEGIKKVQHAPEQGPQIPANTLTLSAGFQPGRVNAEPVEPLPQPDATKIRGGSVSSPKSIYRDAAAQEGNPWVRRSEAPDNTGRTLLVQISSDLINPESLAGAKDEATRYNDKLYSGARPGYARLQDFWEIPQWIGFASHFIPEADVYVVRDVASAKNFLNEAGYDRIAFSALDTNKALIRELVKDYSGKVDVGGYVDPATFSDLPNVKWHDSMASLADDMGIPYSEGVDYSHFQGSDVIPRLTMSKGCRHKCAFCSIPKVVEEAPAEVVLQQADAIAKLGSKLVYLNDKTFGQAKNYRMLSDVYKLIKDQNPNFQGFIIQTTAAQLKVIPAEWLKQSGIKFVELGIESYNDPILRQMHKPATEKMIDEVTGKLRDAGIALIPNIIVGYPSETAETYANTISFLKRNQDIISHANIYNLALYKDAELGKKIISISDNDFNENVLEKSFHTNPEIHRQFAGEVYGLAQRMLEGKPAAAQFSPSKDPEALKWPAVRYRDERGETWMFSAPRHAEAEQKLVDALGYVPHYDQVEDGFVTNSDVFLDRVAAYTRAVKTGQYKQAKRGGSRGILIAEETAGMAPREDVQFQGVREENVGLIDDIPDTKEALFPVTARGFMDRIEKTTPAEWLDWVGKTKFGMSEEAHQAGLQVRTKEELAQLKRLYDQYNNLAMLALKNDNLDQATILGNKAQAANEAYTSATGKDIEGRDYLSVLKQLHGEFEPPMAEGATAKPVQFQPQTASGKALQEDGFDFKDESASFGTRGMRLSATKDGVVVGRLGITQQGPNSASVDLVDVRPEFRKLGLGETLYREAAAELQKRGITKLTGHVITEAPLKIREKLFGKPTKIEEAGMGLGGPAYNVEHAIPEGVQFQPSKDKRAIAAPAIRMLKDRRIFQDIWHAGARLRALEAGLHDEAGTINPHEAGFVTNAGEFLNREEAVQRALELKQLTQKQADEISELHSGNLDEMKYVPEMDRQMAFQFQPKEDPRAIESAAVRVGKERKIFRGPLHAIAIEAAQQELGARSLWNYPIEDGFVTNEGEFLSRAETYKRALELGQITEADYEREAKALGREPAILTEEEAESKSFAASRQFQGRKEEEPYFKPVSTESPAFQRWFGKSRVVDKKGQPLRVFHGTDDPYLDTFIRRAGLAGNFGDAETANTRLKHRAWESGRVRKGLPNAAVVPVYLSIQNPIRVRDVHFDNWGEIALELYENYPDLRKDLNPVLRLLDDRDLGSYYDPAVTEAAMDVMERNGYDGIVYENRIEGKGTDSWIPFYPEQIKSAVLNRGEFSSANADIRFQPEKAEVAAEEPEGKTIAPAIAGEQFQGKRKDEWKLRAPTGGGGAYAHSKAWITPDGKPIQLGANMHHIWMNENPDVRRRYGIPVAADINEAVGANRKALRAGFARVDYGVSNGLLTVEARKKDWPGLRESVTQLVEANVGKIDSMSVSLFDDAVRRVVDADTRQLFKLSNKEKLNNLPLISAGAPEGGKEGPAVEMSAQAPSAQYQPQALFPSKSFDDELKKIRAGESGGQTFEPSGEIWKPSDKKVDLVSLASVNVPLGQLNRSKVEQALTRLADLLEEPNLVAGLFAFSKQGKPTVSIDLNAVVPKKFRQNTLAFAKANDQVAIWDAEKQTEVPAGGKGETKLQSVGEILDALNPLTRGEAVDVNEIIRENRPSAELGEELTLPGMSGRSALPGSTLSQMTKADIAAYYPEAVIPRRQNEPIPSEIVQSPLYKAAGSEDEAVISFGRKLAEFAKEWLEHPSFQSGLKWYSEFAPKLNRVFGKDAPIFAELLAGTSPQQPPAPNFAMALDALEGFKSGRFNKLVTKFEEGLEKIKDGSWKPWIEREIKTGGIVDPPKNPTAETFIHRWVEKYNLLPRQSNGKLYSISSEAVLRILARRWLRETEGLKTQNFVQNLLGTGHEATIDLWADRTMRRVGYSGFKDRWRILPKNATGVSDADFQFAQKAFRHAADQLGVLPDALQGGLWFAEKQLWADNGWSRLDLGDFRKEIGKTEMLKQGIRQRTSTQKAKESTRAGKQSELVIEPRPMRK